MKVPAVIGSLLLHGAMLYGMTRLPEAPKRKDPTIVKMRVERKVKEPPPPPPPPPPVIPPPEIAPKKVRERTVKEIVKEAPPPPPPPVEAPPPPQFAFSVDMGSTVEGGGVEVPAIDGGGNMFADPKEKDLPTGKNTAPPVEPGNGTGGDRYQITQEPKFAIPESQRRPPYPADAKRHEIEGTVLLRVYIDEEGRVADVKVLKSLGGGCTQAAVKWAKTKWKFEPARAGKEAVGMWLSVPVRFVLDR